MSCGLEKKVKRIPREDVRKFVALCHAQRIILGAGPACFQREADMTAFMHCLDVMPVFPTQHDQPQDLMCWPITVCSLGHHIPRFGLVSYLHGICIVNG